MSQEDKIKLINEAIELQKKLNELKQTICRNHRAETRSATKSSINNYENYFNSPNQSGTGKMFMINPQNQLHSKQEFLSCSSKFGIEHVQGNGLRLQW